jgi:hypothetical protein
MAQQASANENVFISIIASIENSNIFVKTFITIDEIIFYSMV